jgi:hypothetical protein
LQINSGRRKAIIIGGIVTLGILGAGGVVEYIINNEYQTSTPMVKVTIKLVDVYCSIKEAMYPAHDHFYMLTTFAAPNKDPNAQVTIQTQLSHPLDITNRQDLEFANGPLTVFEGQIPEQGQIIGGFVAFTDQQGLGWDNIDAWTADIKRSVAKELAQEGVTSAKLASSTSGEILNLATDAWLTNTQMTSGDAHQLGRKELVISGSASETSGDIIPWQFSKHINALDNWNYTVKYQVFRTRVNS